MSLRGLRDPEAAGRLPDRRRPARESLDDPAPNRVGQRLERIISHYANYTRGPTGCARRDPDGHGAVAGRALLGAAASFSPVKNSASTGARTFILRLWLMPSSSRSSAFDSTCASAREPSCSTAGLLGAVGDERRHRDRGELPRSSGAPYIRCLPSAAQS